MGDATTQQVLIQFYMGCRKRANECHECVRDYLLGGCATPKSNSILLANAGLII